MARHVTCVATPLPAAEAFAYMGDVTHFVEWDPGVKRVRRVAGSGCTVTFGDRAAAGLKRVLSGKAAAG